MVRFTRMIIHMITNTGMSITIMITPTIIRASTPHKPRRWNVAQVSEKFFFSMHRAVWLET